MSGLSDAVGWASNELRELVHKRAKQYKVKEDELLFHLLISELQHFSYEWFEGKPPKRKRK